MSKHVIIGVLVLMSISLLGVVGLQLYWINNAIQVKQAEFDRSVNEALARVVEKLETQEAASVVANQMATLKRDSSATETTSKVKATVTTKQAPKAEKPAEQMRTTSGTGSKGAITITRVEPRTTATQNHTLQRASVNHSKGIQLYFSRADSTQLKQAINKLSGGRTTIVPSTINGSATQFQRIAPSKAESLSVAHLKKGSIYRLEQMPDTARFVRFRNGSVDFSVDTLRIMALKLDSLMRKSRQYREFRPMEVASVDINNDSIIIIQSNNGAKLYTLSHGKPHRQGSNPNNRTRVYTRGLKPAEITTEAHIFSYTIPEATSPAAKQKQKQKQQIKDTLQAVVKPLHLAKAPNPKSKTSAISKIEVKKDLLNDVVQKMVVEYVVKNEPLKNRLNLQTLPDLLQTELQNKGINMEFGYCVVSGQNDTVAAHHIKPLKLNNLPTYKASLFPNDIFEKQDYLGLYFADSRSYAIKSLWGMLSLSALFTLVMIATFGTTIHIIYKQKKLSEMKNDFINNMTHEFKTPIATISLATDAIANPKIYEHPEKVKHYTSIIKQENKRMNTQVENVLQIAQLEKNDFKLNFKPVDVHILIAKAIESIRLQVEERMGQINVQLNALKHELRSDEVHLFNVICNLLDNANKYSPTSPEINLLTQNVEGGLLIAVEDKGMGMTKDTQQRVFDKFYRVPTGNLHNVKGFGLGLSYVKAIVQAHKGNVRLKSEPGKGSRFEIYLPLS
ncbi:sensor histidine kinase [Pontibacter sp. H249]|uniref:sensor histidine kinase n=1 Tax=Pontibacter sp. H249 TaxID=3133420 RepID=UPI0030BFFF54